MDDRVRISIELDQAEHDALAAIASETGRTVGELAVEAVQARIDLEQDFDEAMRAGLADAEAGRTISHEDYLVRSAERRRRWLEARAA